MVGLFTDLFSQAIRLAFPELGVKVPKAVVSVATNAKFGDYQCNSALSLVPVSVTISICSTFY